MMIFGSSERPLLPGEAYQYAMTCLAPIGLQFGSMHPGITIFGK